jgi:hypothetical protein
MALQEGSALNARSSKHTLTCFCCRVYKKPKSAKDISESDYLSMLEEGEEPLEKMETCDAWSVKFGIREYKFHRDSSFKRPGGLRDIRANTTILPIESYHVCPVKLNLKVEKYGMVDGYIHLVCGYGNRNHTHHCRPHDGDLPALKRHTSAATQKLIKDGKKASTGSSAL